MFVQWSDEQKILVDEMGLMQPKANLVWLLEKIKEHLAHSDLELEALGRRTVQENCPKMEHQFDFDYFK